MKTKVLTVLALGGVLLGLTGCDSQKWSEQQVDSYEAQLKSVVMLKNHGNKTLPVKDRKKVYLPKRHFPAIPGIWGGISEEKTVEPIDLSLVGKYFELVEKPEQADFAICLIEEPSTGFGYSTEDVPRDMSCYADADGHVYDFAFGLNWQGIIQDERVKTYK